MAIESGAKSKVWMGRFVVQNRESAMQGVLRYHPCNGIQLSTLELIHEHRFDRNLRRHPVLHGIIEGGKLCSVLGAFEKEVAGGRVEVRQIVGNAILLGAHSPGPDLPAWRRLRFTSPAFTGLMNPHGIKPGPVMRGRRGRKVAASGEPPVEGMWGPHILRYGSFLEASKYQANDGSYWMVEQPYLEIHFAEPQSFEEVRRVVAAIELFSCLGEGRFSGPPAVFLWTAPERRRGSRAKSVVIPPCEVLLAQGWYRQVDARHPLERLFLLRHLGEEPLAILARWIDLARRVERPTSLFRSSGETSDIDTKFLFLIQAVEGLHRVLDDRLELDAKEFEVGLAALSEAIPASLSKDAQDVFRSRLPRTNEPGLGSRLREYGARVTTILPDALAGFNKDRAAMYALRNDMSHSLSKGDDIDFDEHVRHLVYYCELLRVLFVFSLLGHLGLSPDVMRGIFGRDFDILAQRRLDAGLLHPEVPRAAAFVAPLPQ